MFILWSIVWVVYFITVIFFGDELMMKFRDLVIYVNEYART